MVGQDAPGLAGDGRDQFPDGAVLRVELDRHLGFGTIDHGDDVHVDLPGRVRCGPALKNLPRPSLGSFGVQPLLNCPAMLRSASS